MAGNRNLAHNWGQVTLSVRDVLVQIGLFIETRLELALSEFRESSRKARSTVPLALGAVILAATTYLLIMLALAAVIAGLFKASPYRWPLAFGLVGGFWLLTGGLAAYFAVREFQVRGLIPQKTLEVLEGDKIWIENEAKNRL